MKAITDWTEAMKEIKDGDDVRLHLGPARTIDGKWNHSFIGVVDMSQALTGDVKVGDLIEPNLRGGFKRLRNKYRDKVLLTRDWWLLKLDYKGDSEEEE